MAIKFLNIHSGEELTAEEEPQIAALWASSDRSPNITQGQDFGWRIAPPVIVEMKQLAQDPIKLQTIAVELKKPYEDLKEYDLLTWISHKTRAQDAPVATNDDYQDAYDEEIKRLTKEQQQNKATEVAGLRVGSTDTQESLADMEKRVELEERLAVAKRAQAEADRDTTTTTTAVVGMDTTTTTTEADTTTTTTKAVSNPTSSSSNTRVK